MSETTRRCDRKWLHKIVDGLRDEIIAEIVDAAAKPEPPEPEPITVEKVVEKLGSGRYGGDRHWDDLKVDLFALVDAQARKDGELCESMAVAANAMSTHRALNEMKIEHYMDCHDAILNAAGLK